jgi:hypothetical protein
MFKKIITLIAPLLISASLYAGIAGNNNSRFGDQNGVIVGSDTNENTFFTATGSTVTAGQILVYDKLYRYKSYANPSPVIYLAPATASGTAYKVLNISSATIMAAATTWTLASSMYTDIITPRNLVFVSSAATTNTAQVMSLSALVTGVDAKGNSATETITFSTTTGTGNIAWSTITSVVVSATAVGTGADTNITIDMGSGVKIGLPCDLISSSEVLKVTENAALSTTYTLSTTYDTITFAAAPDSTKHYVVWLRPTTW